MKINTLQKWGCIGLILFFTQQPFAFSHSEPQTIYTGNQNLNSLSDVTDSGEVVTTNAASQFGNGINPTLISHPTGEFIQKNHQWTLHANSDNSPVLVIGDENYPTYIVDSYANPDWANGGKFRGLSGNPVIRFVNTNFRQSEPGFKSAFGGNQMEIIIEAYRSNFAFHPSVYIVPFMGILGVFENTSIIGNNVNSALFLGLPRKMDNVLIKDWDQLKIEQGMGGFYENLAFNNVNYIFNSGFGNNASLAYNAGRTDRKLHFLNSDVDKNDIRISNSAGAEIWRSIRPNITNSNGNGVSGARLYMLYDTSGTYNLYEESYTRDAAVENYDGAIRIVPKDTPDQPGGINTRDWAYLARVGEQWNISGFSNGANNGTFTVEGKDWSGVKYQDHRAFYFSGFSGVAEAEKSITFKIVSPESDSNGDFKDYKFSVLSGTAGQNQGNNNPAGAIGLTSVLDYERTAWRGVIIPPYPYKIKTNDFTIASQVTAGEKVNWLVAGEIDSNISETTKATVDAYATIDNLDQLYDSAISWKRDNHSYPNYFEEFITTNGTELDLGNRNLVVDATAASAFAVNTDTNTLTIKSGTLVRGTVFSSIKTTGTITLQNSAVLESGYIDSSGTYIYTELTNLNQQDILITDQQNPSSPVTILNVLNQTGTYKTHFAMPAGGEINVLVEREGYAPWTETLPDGELNFIREVTTSLSSITGANQILTIDLLIKLLQKTEAVLNSVNTQGLPVPTVNVTTNTTSSTGPPSVDNQNVELGILTNILAKLTAIRNAVEQP